MLRDEIATALNTAQKERDARRVSTLRLIMAAVKDRDIANRGAGKEAVGDDELLGILAKMIKQREESAKLYEQGNRPELAAQERAEIEIIRAFQPQQLDEAEMRKAIGEAIAEVGASSPKDMGKIMGLLKERYAGQMDFSKVGGIVKELLG